ncbi:MAG: tRNA pseudouridine(55) synthase TruB [Erysipelothrix sp.]|nr:tRNA pseudouridine(55) synthase TruB [Erysipelothrix sp.]
MNGLLLLNKEVDMTSHDLVNIVRRQLDMKRVGHTGTLDPNATGLMVMAFGKATKLVNYLQTDDKEYVLEMKLGVLTDTLDIWGKITKEEDYIKPTKADFKQVLESFKGKQMQRPPMYSAIKIQGKKLYELARANQVIEIPKREIEIYEIELLDYDHTIKIRVACSSGTYIRTLCLDIANKLDTVGTMTSLVRTKIGEFTLEEANTISELRNKQYKIVDPRRALSKYPIYKYENLSDIINGRKIEIYTKDDLVLIEVENKIMAFYERVEENIFKSKRGLW